MNKNPKNNKTTNQKEDTNTSKKNYVKVKSEDEFVFIREMFEPYQILNCSNDTVMIIVPMNNGMRRFIVGSKELQIYIKMSFCEKTNRCPSKKTIDDIETWLLYKAMQKKPKNISYRIKRIKDTIYYDLCTDYLHYVKIDKNGWNIFQGNIDCFAYSPNELSQVIPAKKGGSIDLLRKYVNIADEDWLLFIVYLISCFYEGMQHPVLNINGVWGSGKSTISKIVKSLVDPSPQLLNDLPKLERDLVVTLTSTYYIVFDNLSKLTPEKSDIICKAVTGGNASFREMYTMLNLRNIPYNTLIGFNGISDVIYRGDLAQRTLYFEALLIDETKRLPENEFWAMFEKEKPYILGGIFDILSKAIGLYDTITVRKSHRLADFHKLGCAIAKAIDPDLESEFNEALIRNKTKQVNNTLDNNVMLNALLDYIKKYHNNSYTDSMTNLYLDVKDFIQEDCRNQYNIRYFPKAANAFGKKLKGYVQLCKELGWIVDIYKDSKSGNSHVRISKIENPKNEDTSTIKRTAIFTRRPIFFKRVPILSNKSSKVIYAAQKYKYNKN